MGVFDSLLASPTLSDAAIQTVDQRNRLANGMPLAIAAQQLAQLNLQYLSLVATSGGFSFALAAQLRETDSEQKRRMADCHFSLFTLALNDSRRWISLLQQVAVDSRPTVTSRDTDMWGEFVFTVVFLAWHFAHSQPLAGKVLLSLDDRVADALRRVSVAHLRLISHGAGSWLMPRWPDHPIFWSSLLSYSRASAGRELTAIKCLGRQLLAAESLDSMHISKSSEDYPGAEGAGVGTRKRSGDWVARGFRSD